MATDPTDPLPDIEKAIKEEVAGINAKRRPPMRFSTEPSGVGLSHLHPAAQAPDPTALAPSPEPQPATLPEILDLMINQIMTLDERISVRLTRIERVLGIK